MNLPDLDQRYHHLCEIAISAGKYAADLQEKLQNGEFEIELKGVQDFVTQADQQTEQFIRDKLLTAFPADGFLGEESDHHLPENAPIWVVDPIDGTANYIRHVDQWCISIGLVYRGEILMGAIYDPIREKLFHAQRGQAAYCNQTELKRDDPDTITDPVIMLGYARRQPIEVHLQTIQTLHQAHIEYRRSGSAAMGLAAIAEGWVDGYFESDLNPWDCIAGICIAEQAGATLFQGQKTYQQLIADRVSIGSPALSKIMSQL